MSETTQQQQQETPRVDVTALLSNAAIVAAVVGIIASLYTLVTGRHLTADQQMALTQLIPALGVLLVGFAAKKAKQASFRSTANVAAVVADHLESVGQPTAAAAVKRAVGKLP